MPYETRDVALKGEEKKKEGKMEGRIELVTVNVKSYGNVVGRVVCRSEIPGCMVGEVS